MTWGVGLGEGRVEARDGALPAIGITDLLFLPAPYQYVSYPFHVRETIKSSEMLQNCRQGFS